ncbi:MAG: hypothetical protein LBM09_01350 [Candidatus Nomurabacteria bacterium]|nr:hypothetical protein [Candidatus Nomurabacteria bacterium]
MQQIIDFTVTAVSPPVAPLAPESPTLAVPNTDLTAVGFTIGDYHASYLALIFAVLLFGVVLATLLIVNKRRRNKSNARTKSAIKLQKALPILILAPVLSFAIVNTFTDSIANVRAEGNTPNTYQLSLSAPSDITIEQGAVARYNFTGAPIDSDVIDYTLSAYITTEPDQIAIPLTLNGEALSEDPTILTTEGTIDPYDLELQINAEGLPVGNYRAKINYTLTDNDVLSVNNTDFSENITNFTGGDLIIRDNLSISDFNADSKIYIGTENNPATATECTTSGTGFLEKTANAPDTINSNGDNRARLGCILPNLTPDTYNVYVAPLGTEEANELTKMGTITYAPQIYLSTSSTAIKSQMKQGEVRAMFDSRCQNGYIATTGANSPATAEEISPSANLCSNVGALDGGIALNGASEAGYYRTKLMPDGKLWMIDNLAYAPQANVDYDSSIGVSNAQFSGNSTTSSDTRTALYSPAQYMTSNPTNPSTQLLPSYGYLYNWCAIMGDTGSNCANTKYEISDPNYQTALILKGGISPKSSLSAAQNPSSPNDWKIPSGNADGDFTALDAAMNAISATNPVYISGSANRSNWAPVTGTIPYNNSPWQGVYSGYGHDGKLTSAGTNGRFFSSTIDPTNYLISGSLYGRKAYRMTFNSGSVSLLDSGWRYDNHAVRSVL